MDTGFMFRDHVKYFRANPGTGLTAYAGFFVKVGSSGHLLSFQVIVIGFQLSNIFRMIYRA